MMERFLDLADRVEVSILYDMNALGSKVCFYTYYQKETNSLSPIFIKDDQDPMFGTAPADCWSLDIMTPGGEKKLREVVNHVKAMCAQL